MCLERFLKEIRFKVNMDKKAQSVSSLVILIGVLIVAYVVLIPACDRCELLKTDCPNYCSEKTEDTLLLESPGDLDDDGDDEITHRISSVNIFVKSEPEIKTLTKNLEVSNGLFGTVDKNLEFTLDDSENLEQLSLSFFVQDYRGDLIVRLNNEQVFKGELDGSSFIDLPILDIKERNNIEFSATSPGLVFWLKNKYILDDVKLKKVFRLVNAEQERTFSIGDTEKSRIQDSRLEYTLFCNSDGGDYVEIYLNDNVILQEIADCFSSTQEVDIEDEIDNGRNTLRFFVEGGDYLFSNLKVVNELDEDIDYIEYDFEVEDDQYDDFDEYGLEFEFDGNVLMDVTINGHTFEVDTGDTFYFKDVTDYIREGRNKIRLEPKRNFEIDEIRIFGE